MTGRAGGPGSLIARSLVEDGATVVVDDIDGDRAIRMAGTLCTRTRTGTALRIALHVTAPSTSRSPPSATSTASTLGGR